MTPILRFDAEEARKLEAVYLTPDVIAQRREVLRLLALAPGERVVDVGSGPGLLAVELAAAGFDPDVPRVLPLLNVGFDPDTYSAGIMDVIAAYVAGREGLDQDEVDAWAADLRRQGDGAFFSLNRYLFTATRQA